MKTLNESIAEYKRQIAKGDIRQAYQGIIEYMMKLKAYFKSEFPEYTVSGNIYQGYMDITYFSFTPESLRLKNLKIALVFIHEKTCFDVWLSGVNKQVQEEYWNLIKKNGWKKYRIPASLENNDSIIEKTITDNPDFDDLKILTSQIEKGVLEFIRDVEEFISWAV